MVFQLRKILEILYDFWLFGFVDIKEIIFSFLFVIVLLEWFFFGKVDFFKVGKCIFDFCFGNDWQWGFNVECFF